MDKVWQCEVDSSGLPIVPLRVDLLQLAISWLVKQLSTSPEITDKVIFQNILGNKIPDMLLAWN